MNLTAHIVTRQVSIVSDLDSAPLGGVCSFVVDQHAGPRGLALGCLSAQPFTSCGLFGGSHYLPDCCFLCGFYL